MDVRKYMSGLKIMVDGLELEPTMTALPIEPGCVELLGERGLVLDGIIGARWRKLIVRKVVTGEEPLYKRLQISENGSVSSLIEHASDVFIVPSWVRTLVNALGQRAPTGPNTHRFARPIFDRFERDEALQKAHETARTLGGERAARSFLMSEVEALILEGANTVRRKEIRARRRDRAKKRKGR
jgi:hypothetical protein